MPKDTNFTVVCGVTQGLWQARAERAFLSIRRWAPDVVCECVLCPPDRRLARCLAVPDTPWILFIDADVLATGDVRTLMHGLRSNILIRRSPLHDHPAWRQDRYEHLLRLAGLPYRTVVWNGAFLIARTLARQIARAIADWRCWYLSQRRPIFERPHRKPDQISLTLALAEARVLDDRTTWAGPEQFSWHSRPEELGVIHHFNGQIYGQLAREGRLEAAIEERRLNHRDTETTENGKKADEH